MSHDEPRFGEMKEANDPEELHKRMVDRHYRPWTNTPETRQIDEMEQLAMKHGVPLPKNSEEAENLFALDKEWETLEGKAAPARGELGRTGKIVVGVVLVAIVSPFILLLWHWALGVAGL